VHIIPIRRCNLGLHVLQRVRHFSKPVGPPKCSGGSSPGGDGHAVITISGGEPLLHRSSTRSSRAVRGHGILTASSRTATCYGPSASSAKPRRARVFADQHRQCDARRVSKKEPQRCSIKNEAAGRARRVSGEHQFRAGSGVKNPEDALAVARRARELASQHVGILAPTARDN